ncbi:pseudouridine-5'-phosphate glycosidase [Corynebacterium cystitidis]|uniref:pseudouridine-5'-phosphate glycosidase n=1 Tax=Corynebacterium cystitidis TaxID=35757 RepID=UPI00211E920C|nr:pseudouridine-5'-phosphate glycosidase [Corynebacterium cystitidis]
MNKSQYLFVGDHVQEALDSGSPVVALESTIFTHGLPQPMNASVALEGEQIVSNSGAVPATIGVYKGQPTVGLTTDQIEEMAAQDKMLKASVRELSYAHVHGLSAGTTIAATAHLAQQAGIDVFATGGLGGVHHGASETFDESADLIAMSQISFVLVSSGAKAILDIPATLERFETLNVPVIGYQTDQYPGFYVADSGHALNRRVDTPEQVAEMLRVQRDLGVKSGINICNPVPLEDQLDPELLDQILSQAWDEAERQGISGQASTPFLLDYIRQATDGKSLEANVALYKNNIALAASIAGSIRRGEK